MGTSPVIPPLPPGFVLENQMPPIPPGFVLEGQQPAAPQPQTAQQPPAPPQPSLGRTAGLGARALGRGLGADVLGMSGDIREANDFFGRNAANAGIWLGNKVLGGVEGVLNAAGAGADLPEIPQVPEGAISDILKYLPLMGGPTSDEVANVAETAGNQVGIDLPVPETSGEKLFSNIVRYGSNAALGSTGMARGAAIAGREAPALLRPYVDNAGRMLAGDTASGVGAGTALQALDEYTGEDFSQSPTVRFLTSMLGAAAGGHAMNLTTSPVTTSKSIYDKFAPDPVAPPDPITGARPTIQQVQDAAQFVQPKATDLQAATSNLRRNLGEQQAFDPNAPLPTTAQMTDDVGLQMHEKGMRNTDLAPAIAARDKRVADYNSQTVKSLSPNSPEADLPLPGQAAAGEMQRLTQMLENMVRGAQDNLTGAQTAEVDLAGPYTALTGQSDDASIALDKLITEGSIYPLTEEKTRLYKGLDPNGEIGVDAAPLRAAVDAIQREIDSSSLGPSLAGQQTPQGALSDIRMTDPELGGNDMLTLKKLIGSRPLLSDAQNAAHLAGNMGLKDSIGKLKSTMSEAVAPYTGELKDFYEGPYKTYMEGEAKNFRKEVNFDRKNGRTKTPPTKTAPRFLKSGAGGKELAAEFNRMGAITPDPVAFKKEVRRYVLSKSNLVTSDGRINAAALEEFAKQNQGVLSENPEVAAEIGNLVQEAKSRAGETGAAKQVTREAENFARRGQSDIDRSVFAKAAGQDVGTAVDAMLKGNIRQNTDNMLRVTANDPRARAALKTGLTEHLLDTVGGSSKAGVSETETAISLHKAVRAFKKYEPALERIYSKKEMEALRWVQKRLELSSKRSISAVAGSPTIENATLLSKALRPVEIFLRIKLGAIGGGSEMRKLKLFNEQLPDTMLGANRLVARMVLEPEMALRLMTVPLNDKTLPQWSQWLRGINASAEAGRAQGRR